MTTTGGCATRSKAPPPPPPPPAAPPPRGLRETVSQRALGRPDAAHPVHPIARWCRRGAEVHPVDGSPVGVPARNRPEHGLAQRRRAPVDVTAEQVRVVGLRLCRRADGTGQHQVTKAWREALDLCLHPLAHV